MYNQEDITKVANYIVNDALGNLEKEADSYENEIAKIASSVLEEEFDKVAGDCEEKEEAPAEDAKKGKTAKEAIVAALKAKEEAKNEEKKEASEGTLDLEKIASDLGEEGYNTFIQNTFDKAASYYVEGEQIKLAAEQAYAEGQANGLQAVMDKAAEYYDAGESYEAVADNILSQLGIDPNEIVE